MSSAGKNLVVAASILGLALAAGGCKSTPRASRMDLPNADARLRDSLALMNRAQEAQKAGKPDQAVDLYRQAIAGNPDLGPAWNNLGYALMSRGKDLDFVEAGQCFKRAADVLPTDERPYENLGVLYQKRGFDDQALNHFNMALERNPYSTVALRGSIGSAKRLLRSDEASLQRINRALMTETDPTWRGIFEFERLRVQRELQEKEKAARRVAA